MEHQEHPHKSRRWPPSRAQAAALRALVVGRLRDARSLENGGERVEINVSSGSVPFDTLDMYQKSHWRRYEFAAGLLRDAEHVGDLACGTGYGTVLLAGDSRTALGVDIDRRTIRRNKKVYRDNQRVSFIREDLTRIKLPRAFTTIVSFETLEHLPEPAIVPLLGKFRTSLVDQGRLIFSTPYMQDASPEALRMGFHKTFEIDEERIESWLKRAGFSAWTFSYQSYADHLVNDGSNDPDFIIGRAW